MNSGLVASFGFLSSLTLINLGNLIPIPFSPPSSLIPAVYTGLIYRSAPLISQTIAGLNQTSALNSLIKYSSRGF